MTELQKENQQLRQPTEALKEKISFLEFQLGQLYKLIQGFKSESFILEIIQEVASDAAMPMELKLKKVQLLLQQIKAWMREEQFKVLPKSAFGKP